jgi:predicted nucleotidyltransferase
MASVITPETFANIRLLSKEYKITTPLEKSKKNKQIMRLQLLELYKKPPNEPNLEISAKLKSWLKKLVPSALFNVFSSWNPLICYFLIQMNLKKVAGDDFDYALVENPQKKLQNFELGNLFYMRKVKPTKRDEKTSTEKSIETSLRFLDTEEYLDTVSIDKKLLRNLDIVLKMFDIVTDGKAFTVPCRAYWDSGLKKWMHEYPAWHQPKSFYSLSVWACACIERNVWMKYWQMNSIDPRYPDDTIAYTLENSVLQCVDAILTLPEFFRTLPKQEKQDLVGDIGSLIQSFQEIKQKLGAYQPEAFVPNYSAQPGLYASSVDIVKNYQNSKSIELILQVFNSSSEESFIEFLLSSPLDRTATIFDLTVRLIAFKIKEIHTKKIADELIMQEQVIYNDKKNHKKNNKNNKKKRKNKNKEEPQQNNFIDKLSDESLESDRQVVQDKVQESHRNNSVGQSDSVLDCNDSEFQVVNQKRKNKRFQPLQKISKSTEERKNPVPKNLNLKSSSKPPASIPIKTEKSTKSLWEVNNTPTTFQTPNTTEFPPLSSLCSGSADLNQGLLHREIVDYVHNSTIKIHKKASYIYIILEKINTIVSELFNGTIHVYGSYATGLAIDSSDVDIAVNGVKLESREDVQQACMQLGNVLENLPFVLTCQKIITASVPILKVEVDLFIYLGFSSKVTMDITFVCISQGIHLGLEAISFTKDLLMLFPHIQYLAIVLKTFLYSHKLNSVYKGNN